MKHKILLLLLFFICISDFSFSQCQIEQDIAVCNMATVDFDNNGIPDGIINLYDEYTLATSLTIQNGTWVADPRFASVLDPITGNVGTWALQNSTEVDTINDYTFQLFNSDCGSDPALTIRLILGPYSGVALPVFGDLNVNVEACDSEPFDLFNALVSDASIPPPHLNGEWSYEGNSASFIGINDGSLNVEIPYQEGLPLVDQEVFELIYTVSGVAPCAPLQQTTIRVSVVREVDPGIGTSTDICEDAILAGDYDADINLRDDIYLEGEDIEGIWLADEDSTGQISDEQDSFINIREIYDDLIDSGNLRFGCLSYSFTYKVLQRSAVCSDQSSVVSFRLLEELRPFSQEVPVPQICANNPDGSLDLFDLLTFTSVGDTDFIYDDDQYVNWRLVSGASPLGLQPQPETFSGFIPGYDYSLGTVNTFFAEPGIYVFEYAVSPKINCQDPNELCDPYDTDPLVDPNYCEHPCEVRTGQVTIEILPFDYAGEDTDNLSFCETEESIDLRSLLNVIAGNTVSDAGVWTDEDSNTIDNDFTFPDIDSTENFIFTYTTNNASGCADQATLTFTIFKEADAGAGSDTSISVCSDNLTVTLFDLLEGTPDTTGIWTGPFSYTSPDHLGVFNQNDPTLPILGAGVYTYTVGSNEGCSVEDQSTVTITIVGPVKIGEDVNEVFCKLDGRVNLYSLLDSITVLTGTFEDTDNTGAINADGVLEFETLTNEIYNFRYVVPNALPCDESSLNVAIQILDLPIPIVLEQEFCILDAKRLDDIEVNVLNYNWYDSLESTSPITDNPLLLDDQIYFIASVDVTNCESERLQVSIVIRNLGEPLSNGESCKLDLQDGVSPNGDNQNDTFDINQYNIPIVFTAFQLQIFNRYGSMVYEGNQDTEEFRGNSNVAFKTGEKLPSGTYFYIITPNKEDNLPIQGSFYLSR